MKAIKNGTYVNSTHLSYTFLCSKCFSAGTNLVFQPTDVNGGVGWALSSNTPSGPKSASATLSMHSAGWGLNGLTVQNAKSANYNTYAAMAV